MPDRTADRTHTAAPAEGPDEAVSSEAGGGAGSGGAGHGCGEPGRRSWAEMPTNPTSLLIKSRYSRQ
jgi:hypothetical protein